MSQSKKVDLLPTSTKYRPIAELGRGGMATVYLTVAQGPAGFNKLQVLKRLRPALAADPEFLQMFLEEARLAARVNHPNVVQTNEVGYDGQYYYIAMEYLDGQPLEALLRRARDKIESKVIPLELHLKVIADALAGLHFAHELADFDGTPLNVVHRDMSPHNVMVTYQGSVKVLDFGIAKAADSSSDTRTGIMKGKCAYMAAEQFGGENVDRRADIFAVGVMLWQAATGRRLWQNMSDAEIFAKLAKNEIPTPRSVNAEVPEALENIIMKALAQSPSDRYSTASEFQAVVEEFMGTMQSRVTPRELGKFVSDLFEDRRKIIKDAIESQLKNPEIISTSDVRKSAEVPLLWSLAPGNQTASETAESPELPSEVGAFGQERRRRILVLGGLALAAITTIGVALLVHRSHPEPDPVGTTESTVEPPVTNPSQGPGPGVVQVIIKASPAEAKIFLDDVPLPGNPATNSFPRDGAAHMLRIEAAGFEKKTQLVTFNTKTISIDVALEKEAKPVVGVWRPHSHGGSNNTATAQQTTVDTTPANPPSIQTAAAPTATNPPDAHPRPHGPALDTSTDPWTGKPAPSAKP